MLLLRGFRFACIPLQQLCPLSQVPPKLPCRYFGYFFDFAIFVNAIFIGFGVNNVEVAFLVLFNSEIVLKIYALGPKEYFRNAWNTLVRITRSVWAITA